MSQAADEARRAIVEKGFAGAKPLVVSLCEQWPEDQTLHAFLALGLMWTGEMEASQELVDRRMALGPSASILGVASELQSLHGDRVKAKSLLEQGLALDPDDYLVLRAGNTISGVQKDYSAAEAIQSRWIELFPQDADVYTMRIAMLQGEGRLDELQEYIENGPEWFKRTAQYHSSLGRLAFSRHSFPEMEAQFQQAVAMVPESAMYWAYLGQAQVHLGKNQEAERSAQFAVDLNPRSPLALRTLAKVAQNRGDSEAAKQFNARATEAIPALAAGAKGFMAADELSKGNLEGALKLYRQQAKTDHAAGATTARKIILSLLVQHGRWKEARKQLDEIVRLNDPTPGYEVSRCLILYHEGAQQEALARMCELAFAAEPVTEVFGPALQLFLKAGDEPNTEKLVQRILEDPPGNPSSCGNIVMVLSKAGRKSEARAVHDAAYRKYPGTSALTYLEAGFTAEDGDLERAFRTLNQLPPSQRPRIRIPFWKVVKVVIQLPFKRLRRKR